MPAIRDIGALKFCSGDSRTLLFEKIRRTEPISSPRKISSLNLRRSLMPSEQVTSKSAAF
jgi:hypothetical protein